MRAIRLSIHPQRLRASRLGPGYRYKIRLVRSSSSRPFALLPLILLAIMMALGLVIEEVRYHTLLWVTKIPLALLLAVAFLKGARER